MDSPTRQPGRLSSRSLAIMIPLLVLGAGMLLLAIYVIHEYRFQRSAHLDHSVNIVEAVGTRISTLLPQMMSINATHVMQQEMASVQKYFALEPIIVIDDSRRIRVSSETEIQGLMLDEVKFDIPSGLLSTAFDSGHVATAGIRQADRAVGVFPFMVPAVTAQGSGPELQYAILALTRKARFGDLWPVIWPQALAVAGMLGLVVGFLWWLLRRIVILPLNRLTASARAIVAGDSPDLSQEQSGKELAEVADAMDSLATLSRINSEVQAMQKRLYTVMEELVDEVFVCRIDDFTMINANKSALQRLGYSAEEMQAMKPWDFVTGHTAKTLGDFVAPLIDGSVRHMECECEHLRKDGTTYPVRARMQYMATQSPPLLITIAQDLSELRHHQQNSALLERAMATVSEGVIMTDTDPEDRRIVYANQALCDMSGYGIDELLGQSPDILHRDCLDQPQLESIRQALADSTAIEVQLDCTRKDGSHFMDEVSLSPIFNREGELTHYLGIHRDVTQRLLSEEREKQSQKIKAIGHLSGGLAHDFNNLLSVILGNLELIRANCTSGDQVERIDGAENAAHMGAHLTRRLLSFASQQKLTPVVTNVNEHIRNAIAILAPTIGEAITVRADLATDLWNTLTDPGEIETALINLTINSRDAMCQGGTITIRSDNVILRDQPVVGETDIKPGEYVCLCVSDDGPGMGEDVQARILEPFFTTKEDGSGSGLGLASVFGFAKQSEGYLNVCSTEGRGTTVSIYLPRHMDGAVTSEQATGPYEADHDGIPAVRVLVVEDRETVRALTREQLHALGCRTLEAVDGAQAIQLLESDEEIDLVLSDIVMPGGTSGYDVAEWVREHRPGCRILLTSGFNAEAGEGRGATLEGVRFLAKPFRMKELESALQEALAEGQEILA